MKLSVSEIVVLVLAVGLLLFRYWGLNTVAGRRAYDEMAGMIPLFAGWLGGALIAVWIAYRIYQHFH